jgi:glutamate-5-semialdehyde dehydrogenase
MAPDLHDLGRRAVAAARVVATAGTDTKDAVLQRAAELLESRTAELLAANEDDVRRALDGGAGPTQIDRLTLTGPRVASMAAGLRAVAAQGDPLGEVVAGWVRPNGLRVMQVRVPLGVVGVIYENRPNVTSDAAGLCLKSGNAVMLRGSSSALRSNQVVATAIRDALQKEGLPADAVILVEDTDRAGAIAFIQLEVLDCLIPRGGRSLLDSVRTHATVPVILDGDGNCHVYLDAAADPDMAVAIVANAKMQRPGVCNAAESLLVHQQVTGWLPRLAEALPGVELVGDERARAAVPTMGVATDEDFASEFLGLKLSVAIVDDLDAAIDHIARFGTGHSEAIVTGDLHAAQRFVHEVDAAAVLVNASTRFVDGGELGLGAEIGISTQKLHARGPLGLQALTSVKYVIHGEGQVRS